MKARHKQERSTAGRALPERSVIPENLGEVGESVWIDVIRKMDEVYSELLQYEVALEQKNAELEETQQFLFSVLTSMSDILIVCDRKGAIQEVNRALVKLVGREAAALRGVCVLELLADKASREQAAQFIHHLQGEGLTDCELQFRATDGTAIPVAVNWTPRYNTVGKAVGMVLVGRPVGELKRAYQALREAHEDLKRTQQQLVHSEKMASLGLLVAGVAHELNNPISFVLGNVHALKRYVGRLWTYLEAVHAGAPEARLAELRRSLRVDRILEDLNPLIEGTIEGAERTRDIVDALKRFSATDSNENVRFNLREVLERSVRWVIKASGTHLQVVMDVPPEIPVMGSAGQMQQVIINLVQNAVDSVGRKENARLEITGRAKDGRIEIAFHDNGPGIPEQYLPRVFDPFFTTKPVGKGTGLGLSISYGIVERHGGRLCAANHPEGGAVFTLALPLA